MTPNTQIRGSLRLNQIGRSVISRIYRKIGMPVACLWLVLLIGWVAKETTGISKLSAGVAVALTAIGAFLVPFSKRLESVGFPRMQDKGTRVTVGVALSLELMFTITALGYQLYDSYRAVDIVDQIETRTFSNLSPGRTIEFDFPIPEKRSSAVFVFGVSDRNPRRGACAPLTNFSIGIQGRPGIGSPEVVHDGDKVSIGLPRGKTRARIIVRVGMDYPDPNCVVNLVISEAYLKS